MLYDVNLTHLTTELDIKNIASVTEWCKANQPALVVVGPEDPLNHGIADALNNIGIPCFGPSEDAAQIECDKTFAKNFMKRHDIPTAEFKSFTSSKEAIAFVKASKWSGSVVKAAGLAAGKGVVVADSREEAIAHVKHVLDDRIFGDAGSSLVIEERLEGYEVSVLAFCDGKSYSLMPPAQDHKRAYDNDEGPNTGGMGAFCPIHVEESLMQQIEKQVIKAAVDGMREEGKPFIGVLYAGVMVTKEGPKVLEYNCRFGDPETQVILPLLQTDLLDVMNACSSETLHQLTINWKIDASACGVVLASENYPATPVTGRKVTGIPSAESTGLLVFQGGTKKVGADILSSGGRVLTVVSLAKTLKDAATASQAGVQMIKLNGSFHRKDIAHKELKRLQDMGLTYKSSGVDIDAGEQLVDRIKEVAILTGRSGVMDQLGGFGALFDLQAAGYDKPVLVSGTDGVGTKLRVALECKKFDTVGIDLVAMCVNDILVQGAEPLFFLDYFACGRLSVDLAAEVIRGIASGCRESGCALVGGETAEMPGMYHRDDFDLAGFAVGAVNREAILPRVADMKEGDVLIGLPSSGVHSNGFSLIRKLVHKLGLSYHDPAPFEPEVSLGQALLTPTKLYVKAVLPVVKAGLIKGLAHITGGGLIQNIPRILPKNLAAELDASNWKIPAVYEWIQREGKVSDDDMLTTFNCGLGMICVVEPRDAVYILNLIHSSGISDASFIGKLEKRDSKAVIVKNFKPEASLVPQKSRKRVAVLISGSGTNLQSLMDKCADRRSPAEIVLVISNIAGVAGLERAKQAGIEARVIPHAGKKRVAFDMDVHAVLLEKKIDIVCLAGFMRIVSKEFVDLWEGRLINIHPSLLPSFPGMHTHEDALNAGVRVHGCTVHFVDAGVDTGAIILQEAVAVLPGDTPTVLQERVKVQAEHKIYPLALELLASGRVSFDKENRKAVWSEQ